MDNSGKRTALNIMLVAGGFGLLAVSCSDSEEQVEAAAAAYKTEFVSVADTQAIRSSKPEFGCIVT